MSALLYFGWLGIGTVLVLLLLTFRTRGANLLFFTGILFVSGLATQMTPSDTVEQTFWMGIQTRRSDLFLAFGALGTLCLLSQSAKSKSLDLSIASLLYFMSLLYAAFIRGYHEGFVSLFEGTVFCIFTVAPLCIWSVNYAQLPKHLSNIQRAILFVNVLTILFIAVQFVQDSSALTMDAGGGQSRFRGLLSNPQHAGAQFALLGASCLWVMIHDKARYFSLALGTLAVDVVLILWTGSRTSLAMLAIAGGAIAYPRLGRQAIYAPLFAALGFGLYSVLTSKLGVDINAERLSVGGNTRSEAWRQLIREGLSSPIFGVGVENSLKSENGWLYGFATGGLGMLALLSLWTFAVIREILIFVRRRNQIAPALKPTVYYCIGILLAYFGGAVFEGYFISRVSTPLCIVLLALTLSLMLRKTSSTRVAPRGSLMKEFPNADYGTSP